MTTTTSTVALPEAGGGWREIELAEPRAWEEHPKGFRDPHRLCRRPRRR